MQIGIGKLFFKILLLLIVTLYYYDCGINNWVNDEPLLVKKAFAANELGIISSTGLTGTQGYIYGPVPVIIYQLMLSLLGPDLVLTATIKSVFFSIILIFTGLRIAKLMGLEPAWGLLPLSSAMIHFYSRTLWDNCFLIIFSLLFFYNYFLYQRQQKIYYIYTLGCLVTLLFNTHLMSLVLIIPGVFLIILKSIETSKKHVVHFCFGSLLAAFCSLPYLSEIISVTTPVRESIAADTLSYLSGFNYINSGFFAKFLLSSLLTKPQLDFLVLLDIFFILLFLSTFFLLLKNYKKLNDEYKNYFSLSMLIISLQLVIVYWKKLLFSPHYMNCTWVAFYIIFLLACLQVERRFRSYLITFLLIINFSISAYCLNLLDKEGGTRTIAYGSTLKNQIVIAKNIGLNTNVSTNINLIINFPYALRTLVEIYGQKVGPQAAMITYKDKNAQLEIK